MMRVFSFRCIVVVTALFCLAIEGKAEDQFIEVGVAKVDITPTEPVRLSGYRTRREPAAEVDGKLWAKALAFGGDKEKPAVLITVELVGITLEMTDALAARLEKKAGITRAQLAVCVTHTHSGPFVRGNLPHIFGEGIPKEHWGAIDRYADSLMEKLEQVALAALADRKPASLSTATGRVDFAANRRAQNSLIGRAKPTDHDLPVLFVKGPGGEVRAVLVNYACHCTTLGGTYNRVHGDWAGAAAEMIEKRYPGAIGMVSIGCGADQNPKPRGLLSQVEQHGLQITKEVDHLLQGKTRPVTSTPACRYELAKLPFGKLPNEAELKERANSKVERVRYYAGILRDRKARGIDPPKALDYPVQTWTFGDDLGMVFLAGEVVVDYSLRLKRELDAERLWVNGYSNDVPAYIASARVIGEGGYEVDTSMDSYDKPTRFDPAVEDIIVSKVKEMMPKSFAQRRKIRADVAQDFWREMELPPAPILSPQKAIASFRLPPGFRIEAVATEPLVEDPVTCGWDADGRLWVVEMRGYMHNLEGDSENEPSGSVAVLEDEDGDGVMDKRTVFLDGLVMPRAIAFVEGGVLIGAPPTLWYCRDTDGDLVCDEKISVYESYGQRDAASRTASGLMRRLDNWMVNTRLPERFQFRDGKLITRPDAYRGDFGVTQDDYGRVFSNTNSSWLHADFVPFRYMMRQSNLFSPAGIYERVVTDQEVHTIRVNPGVVAGHTEGMLREDGRLAIATAATSPGIYRGDRYPAGFYGNAFVPEPAGNVVGRFTLKEKGTRLEAVHKLTPDPDWNEREFLASSDERFRPVQATTGPDGCLYIVDFYRGIIEYKLFMNKFLGEQIMERNLNAPLGLGRIYRIIHEGKSPGAAPDLGNASAAELIGALNHPNGWWRDTAQRLLVDRGDASAAEGLRTLVMEGKNPLGRLHALWTLEGLGVADRKTVIGAMSDANPKVRAAAMRIGESEIDDERYLSRVLELGDDSDPGVQLQVLLSLGQIREGERALPTMAKIFLQNTDDAHFRHGTISGIAGRELNFLKVLDEIPGFGNRPMGGRGVFLRELASVIFRQRRPKSTDALLAAIAGTDNAGIQVNLLDGMLRASKKGRPLLLEREPDSLLKLRASGAPEVLRAVVKMEKLVTWPGDTTKTVALAKVRPLSKADQAQFDLGRKQYQGLCIACHQIHGRGMASMAPPLVNSPWVLGPEERLIRIVLQGIYGPLTIHGTEWNLVMPGQKDNPALTDENIAAILTYVRREWDNDAEVVRAASVTKVRAATSERALPWTVKELEMAVSKPYKGKVHQIPGLIEAEHYDEGEAESAYHDRDKKNRGENYRGETQVDIEKRSDASNGHGVGWTREGEWLRYTVEVRDSSVYELEIPVASKKEGGIFHIEIDGKDVTGPIQVPDTGSWQTLKLLKLETVKIEKGVHIMRVVMDIDGPSGSIADVDYFKFVKSPL